MKAILRVGVAVIWLLMSGGRVRAEGDDYQIVLNTTVEIRENGQMAVKDKWEITNLTATRYVAEFGYGVNGEVKNIKSANTQVSVGVQKNEAGGDLVLMQMSTPVVGEQKTAVWEVNYELNSNVVLINQKPLLAIIKLPQVKLEEAIDEKKMETKWAESWGQPLNKELGKDENELLVFGQKQRLLLTATLEKKNMANTPVNIEINLPDTSIISVEPLPDKIKELSNGKTVANFLSKEQETLHIQYQSIVEIEPREQWDELIVTANEEEWRQKVVAKLQENLSDAQIEVALLHEDDKIEVDEKMAQVVRENENEQRAKTKRILIMAGAIGATATVAGGVLVLVKKQRDPLRRKSEKSS